MSGSYFIAGTRYIVSCFGRLVTLNQGHWDGCQNFFLTHRSTMCGLKKLASGVFPESCKVLAEWRWWWRRQRQRTKNNKSPGYPGWLKNDCMCSTDPFKFRWSRVCICNSYYYHHQIPSINICCYCHIFPWLHIWGGLTIIFCQLLHIL